MLELGTQTPRLYTRREVMTVLRVTAPTVDRMIRGGTLPVVRIGRRIRIRAEDLERLLTPSTQEEAR